MKVFNDFVLIQPTEEKERAGIILVDVVDKQLRRGVVVACGCGMKLGGTEQDDLIGKEVLYAVSGGFAGFGEPVRVDLDGKKYDLVAEKQLVLVVPKAM